MKNVSILYTPDSPIIYSLERVNFRSNTYCRIVLPTLLITSSVSVSLFYAFLFLFRRARFLTLFNKRICVVLLFYRNKMIAFNTWNPYFHCDITHLRAR